MIVQMCTAQGHPASQLGLKSVKPHAWVRGGGGGRKEMPFPNSSKRTA